jgi:site-specific DNA-methyltransferase (adenine-specific)
VKIIEKKVEELIPYVNNPRNNEEAIDFVAASIKEFGFKNPIIIDKENVIVAGHTRLAAAKKLGLESVPCIMADDLTEQQIKAFRLADNKTAELATWDLEKLEIELEGIDDLEMTDFGFEELEDSGDVVEVIEDEVPDVPEEPKSKLGDVFKLGRHRLICGDSTDPKTLEILMGGGRSGTSIHRPAVST